MLTAILPIRIEKNAFWSSPQGLECIEGFMQTCTRVQDIDHFVVITQDDQVSQRAEQHGMEISRTNIPGSHKKPYTFEQVRSLTRNFQTFCLNQNDALLTADHRNLFLDAEDIDRALRFYKQDPEAGVISLAYCRDFPCQFRAYFNFLGCEVIHFDSSGIVNGTSDSLQVDFPYEITCQTEGHGEITTTVSGNGSGCRLSFCSKNLPIKKFITQIIPLGKNGPLYEKSQELVVTTHEYETTLEFETNQLLGIILVFTILSQTGSYDTVEFFTPEKATWELGASAATVFCKKNQEPMYGRQQFPPTYSYDGTLCILNTKHLLEKPDFDPALYVLNNSCIVTDWVDFLYTTASQKYKVGLEA